MAQPTSLDFLEVISEPVVFCLIMVAVCMGYLMGVMQQSTGSKYLDVFQSWWRLNVSHRFEVGDLRILFNTMGIPLSLSNDVDRALLATAFSGSLATLAHFRRGPLRLQDHI